MNAEQAFTTEEAFLSPAETETRWKIDAEPSNIIRLAEQGLLQMPRPEDKFEDEEFSSYNNYSPLNEW
jgi:hypothetical protein